MQRRVEKKIGDLTFLIPLLGVAQQRRLLFKLAGVAGVPTAQLLSAEIRERKAKKENGDDNGDDNGVDWGESLTKVFHAVAEGTVLEVYEDAIAMFRGAGAQQDNGCKVRYLHPEKQEMAEAYLADVYDAIFDQRLDLEFRWVWSCLEVNFSGFLERLKSTLGSERLGALMAKVSASESQETSTG